MKRIVFILTAWVMTVSASAQFPGGGAPVAGAGKGPGNIGHVYGKIVDENGSPVAEASVILLQNRFDTVSKKKKDILLKAVVTKGNGDFDFPDLPVMGQLKMKITAIGFKAADQNVSFQMKMPAAGAAPSGGAPAGMGGGMGGMMNAFDKDLGNIKLTKDIQDLTNVTVVATKPMMKLDIDKKVFNVEKNITSAGGTGLDVMRNVPSVQVDIDGNVTLRNAAPQLFIEGRPTTLTLDQIPADAIESVEVITNPSAKYDASGGNAGILNIILKKNKKSGYNGNLRAGVDKRGAVNGGGDFNVRQGKLNFSASANVNQNKSRTNGTTDRQNFFAEPFYNVYQTNANKTNGQFIFGRVGLDYFATNRTTFSVAGIRVHGEFKPNETINAFADTLLNTGKLSTYSERQSSGKRQFNAYGLQLGMKHLFPKEGEEFTADLNIFSGKNEGDNTYLTQKYNTQGGVKTGTEFQELVSSGTNKNFTLQADYVKPINKIKLETGLRAQLRKLTNINDNYIDNQLIQSATSNYKNDDNVYAAYLSLSSSYKDFGYKVGLRGESSEYTGTLLSNSTKYGNSYPISLFPSLFLSQKLNKKQELQLSVTRRVNRPNFFQIIPFVDFTDKLNITKGNPGLKPEFTQSYEASYSKTLAKKDNILVSLYYKHTTDLITRFQEKGINPANPAALDTVLINTFVNANSSMSYGAEATSINYLTSWWDISTNLNVYNAKINTNNLTGTSQDAIWSWFGKFNSNFKLPAKFSLQLSATYQSKTNLPINSGGGFMGPGGPQQAQSSSQGYNKPIWGADIALKKTFMKNDALAVTLNVSDVFRTRIAEQYSYSNDFTQTYSRLRDPQMFRLNLSYRFGKLDMSLFKRKNNSQNGGAATEGMQ